MKFFKIEKSSEKQRKETKVVGVSTLTRKNVTEKGVSPVTEIVLTPEDTAMLKTEAASSRLP